jgi:PTS system mannitol-specific IIC component
MTPRGGFLGVFAAVLVAAAVSFLVASVILRRAPDTEEDDEDESSLLQATQQMETMKGKKSSATAALTGNGENGGAAATTPNVGQVKSIVFACDAGMGSSAMGASLLRNKVQKANLDDVSVTNASINNLTGGEDLIITHKDLTDRARQKVPGAIHISVDNFLGSPKYDQLVEQLKDGGNGAAPADGSNGSFDYSNVRKIIFACDAGMGSSAMGASLLRDKAKKAGLTDVVVENKAINQIPDDADVIITHRDLTDRARQKRPDAHHVSVDNFLGSPRYDEIIQGMASTRA